MANFIQGMRIVYDMVKASKDMDKPFSEKDIQGLLEGTVRDESIRSR